MMLLLYLPPSRFEFLQLVSFFILVTKNCYAVLISCYACCVLSILIHVIDF
jgi:hypothetical protein